MLCVLLYKPTLFTVHQLCRTFCMMSISSGLRSRSIEEMLSILFLRTMPPANGLAMMPGDAWKPIRNREHIKISLSVQRVLFLFNVT